MDKSVCSNNKVKSKLPSQLAGPKCCSPHPRAALSSKVEFDIAGSGFPLENPRLTEVRLWGDIVFGLRVIAGKLLIRTTPCRGFRK